MLAHVRRREKPPASTSNQAINHFEVPLDKVRDRQRPRKSSIVPPWFPFRRRHSDKKLTSLVINNQSFSLEPADFKKQVTEDDSSNNTEHISNDFYPASSNRAASESCSSSLHSKDSGVADGSSYARSPSPVPPPRRKRDNRLRKERLAEHAQRSQSYHSGLNNVEQEEIEGHLYRSLSSSLPDVSEALPAHSVSLGPSGKQVQLGRSKSHSFSYVTRPAMLSVAQESSQYANTFLRHDATCMPVRPFRNSIAGPESVAGWQTSEISPDQQQIEHSHDSDNLQKLIENLRLLNKEQDCRITSSIQDLRAEQIRTRHLLDQVVSISNRHSEYSELPEKNSSSSQLPLRGHFQLNVKVESEVEGIPNGSYVHNQVPLSRWSASEVTQWLAEVALDKFIPSFAKYNITGLQLSSISFQLLEQLGIDSKEDRELLLSRLYDLQNTLEADPTPPAKKSLNEDCILFSQKMIGQDSELLNNSFPNSECNHMIRGKLSIWHDLTKKGHLQCTTVPVPLDGSVQSTVTRLLSMFEVHQDPNLYSLSISTVNKGDTILDSHASLTPWLDNKEEISQPPVILLQQQQGYKILVITSENGNLSLTISVHTTCADVISLCLKRLDISLTDVGRFKLQALNSNTGELGVIHLDQKISELSTTAFQLQKRTESINNDDAITDIGHQMSPQFDVEDSGLWQDEDDNVSVTSSCASKGRQWNKKQLLPSSDHYVPTQADFLTLLQELSLLKSSLRERDSTIEQLKEEIESATTSRKYDEEEPEGLGLLYNGTLKPNILNKQASVLGEYVPNINRSLYSRLTRSHTAIPQFSCVEAQYGDFTFEQDDNDETFIRRSDKKGPPYDGERVLELNGVCDITHHFIRETLSCTNCLEMVLLRDNSCEELELLKEDLSLTMIELEAINQENRDLTQELDLYKDKLDRLKERIQSQKHHVGSESEGEDSKSPEDNMGISEMPIWKRLQHSPKSLILQVLQNEVEENKQQKTYLDKLLQVVIDFAPELLQLLETSTPPREELYHCSAAELC